MCIFGFDMNVFESNDGSYFICKFVMSPIWKEKETIDNNFIP